MSFQRARGDAADGGKGTEIDWLGQMTATPIKRPYQVHRQRRRVWQQGDLGFRFQVGRRHADTPSEPVAREAYTAFFRFHGEMCIVRRKPYSGRFRGPPNLPRVQLRQWEADHDESIPFTGDGIDRRIIRLSPPCPIGRRQARQGAFRDVVQCGGTKVIRPRHAVSALVLVPRLAEDVRGHAEGRSLLQHCLLGHRPQPVVESAYGAAGKESRGGGGGDRESENGRLQDGARASLCQRAGGDV